MLSESHAEEDRFGNILELADSGNDEGPDTEASVHRIILIHEGKMPD